MIRLWKFLYDESHFKRLFMTEITTMNENRRKGAYRAKKHSLRVDMTPMVDLGFLLIAFFVITTEMNKPAIADLYMPKDGDSTKIPESKVLTLLLSSDNNIFYHEGDWKTAVAKNEINKTDFSNNGIRNVIQKKQSDMNDKRNDLMILFKAGENVSYQNIIDMLDEMLINDVRKYTLLKISSEEKEFLKARY